MANSVDPDQTAPIGAVCSGSRLFASILNSSVMLGNFWQQTTLSRHFQMYFFMALYRLIGSSLFLAICLAVAADNFQQTEWLQHNISSSLTGCR